MCVELDSRVRSARTVEERSLTWTNPVAMITPVPNCLIAVNAMPLMARKGSLFSIMGKKTAMELVPSIANSEPIRSGTL